MLLQSICCFDKQMPVASRQWHDCAAACQDSKGVRGSEMTGCMSLLLCCFCQHVQRFVKVSMTDTRSNGTARCCLGTDVSGLLLHNMVCTPWYLGTGGSAYCPAGSIVNHRRYQCVKALQAPSTSMQVAVQLQREGAHAQNPAQPASQPQQQAGGYPADSGKVAMATSGSADSEDLLDTSFTSA